jgi:hypothetical protein
MFVRACLRARVCVEVQHVILRGVFCLNSEDFYKDPENSIPFLLLFLEIGAPQPQRALLLCILHIPIDAHLRIFVTFKSNWDRLL